MRLRNSPRASRWAGGIVLMAVGTIIIAADILWIVTGEEGHSPIGMRGGRFGFWLSLLTAVGCVGLGLLMIVRSRRRGPRVA